MRWAPIIVVATLLVLLSVCKGHAERRAALVIGNGAYEHADQLANPLTDARRMRDKLAALGFEVIFRENVPKKAIERAIGDFASIAQDADVALVYFAGHGATFSDVPYVVPIDAQFANLAAMPYELLPVETLIGELRRAKGLRIAILDACRDNAAEQRLKRTAVRGGEVTRGLGRVINPDGLIVAYSTQYMSTAKDGPPDGDSPFTAALLEHIATPGLDIKDLLFRVGNEVSDKTHGQQHPEISISFYGSYALVPVAASSTASHPAVAPPPISAASASGTEDQLGNLTRCRNEDESFSFDAAATACSALINSGLQNQDLLGETFNNRCWWTTLTGRQLQQALSDCNEAIKLRPGLANAYGSRGFVYLRLARIDEAIEQFDRALRLEGGSSYDLYARAIAKRHQKDYIGCESDATAAKMLKSDITERFEKYGIKFDRSDLCKIARTLKEPWPLEIDYSVPMEAAAKNAGFKLLFNFYPNMISAPKEDGRKILNAQLFECTDLLATSEQDIISSLAKKGYRPADGRELLFFSMIPPPQGATFDEIWALSAVDRDGGERWRHQILYYQTDHRLLFGGIVFDKCGPGSAILAIKL